MEKVAPRLVCGLGNRLFQTVAAIRAAELIGGEPVFFLPRMGRAEHGNFNTLFTLFPKIKILETMAEWVEVNENDDGSLPSLNKYPLTVLSGFFQNTNSFPTFSNIYLPSPPSSLPPTDRWAIHFRLGDYQILPHYHIGLGKYYYKTIMEKIPYNSSICLFSDSPDKLPAIARELQGFGYRVEIYENSDVIETFKMFASCSAGSICSNSTFAWWAAYFAWRQSGEKYKAFFPDRWIIDHTTRVFTLPFTRTICLDEIHAFPSLNSFSHY
jgi:hypothetical protein